MGFGAVLIDQQHGLLDERTAFECVQRLEKFPDCFPIVRVCDNSTALISRALDAGACGNVDTRHHNSDDELHFSRNHRANDQHSCRGQELGGSVSVPSPRPAQLGTHKVSQTLHCLGQRTSHVRALILDAGPDDANKYVKAFAMIETAEAIKNLDAILDVEGLDGVFVGRSFKSEAAFLNLHFKGPYDLSISLGIKPMGDLTQADMVAVTRKVLEGCKARGKVAMLMVGSVEMAQQKLDEGWNGVFPGADITWIINAAKQFSNIAKK